MGGLIKILGEHRAKRAGTRIRPAVIRAAKERDGAIIRTAQLHATVSTGIEESAYDAVVASHQHHRLSGKGARDVITLVWQLRVVRQKEPGAPEQALLLQLIELRVDVHAARDVRSLLTDEVLQIRVISQSSGAYGSGIGCRHK